MTISKSNVSANQLGYNKHKASGMICKVEGPKYSDKVGATMVYADLGKCFNFDPMSCLTATLFQTDFDQKLGIIYK